MALPEKIDLGTSANSQTGDPIRTAFGKSNAREDYLEANKTDKGNYAGTAGDLKVYIDTLLQGLKWKDSVLVATTANIALTGEQTIDGVLTSASRVLVKDQTIKTENGIYVSGAGAWVRSTDADENDELVSATVSIEQGTVLAGDIFTCNTSPITLGTTDISFVAVSRGTVITEHNALSGKQGGTPGEYNHLTNAELIKLQNAPATTEPSFSKNTAFNKDFGTTAGTVAQGDDSRIINGQAAFDALSSKANDSEVVKNLQEFDGTPIAKDENGLVILPDYSSGGVSQGYVDDGLALKADKSKVTRTADTLTEAKALTDLTDGESIRILGRVAKNDGLIYDKEFYYFSGDVTAEDGGTVFTAVGGTLKAFVSGSYYLHYFGFSTSATSADNATAFNLLQQSVSNGQVVTAKSGTYNLDNVSIIKSGFYDFNGVTFINNNDVSGSSAILIDPAAVTVKIEGLTQQYTGLFYTSNTSHTGSFGIQKTGIIASNSETLLQNCKATGFSYAGFMSVFGNDQLIAIDCVGNNNGYAGISCNYGLYLEVRGGTYNENGGSNNTDGYGIVANAGLGSAKIEGAISLRNRTRNIDSHDILEVKIIGNTTEEAGVALPQWFNVAFATGYNIRLTQKVQSAIITNNTAKNSFGGIVVDSFIEAGQLDNKLENILIDDNILENNTENIYIRQLRTKKLSISNNIHVGTGRAILIDANEVLDDSNFYYIENLKISDNLFSGDIYVDLSNFAGSTKKHEISVSGGSFNQATFFLRDNPTQIKIKDTNHYKVEVSANSTETHLVYEANEVDKNNQASDFTPTSSSFFGTYKIHNNDFLNSNQSFLLRARSNGINTNNRFKNYGVNVLFGIQSATTATNFRIKGNEFDNSAAITPIRFNTNADVLVADNVFKGSVRIDYPNGAGTSAKVIQGKVLFDSFNNNYDLGFTSLPSLGDYVFNVGSVMKNNAPTSDNPFNWVYTSSGWISQKTNFEHQLNGNRVTASIATTYAIDWNAGSQFVLTPTAAVTLSNANLPVAPNTKVISGVFKAASFAVTFPASWKARANNDPLSATLDTHFTAETISDTVILYTLENIPA